MAAGGGSRFGGSVPKQYASLAGEPLLRRTIVALNGAIAPDMTFVVLAPDDAWYGQRIGAIAGVRPVYGGGATRAESVRHGLVALEPYARADDWVVVHDAARPCIDGEMLARLLRELSDEPVGGLLAIPLADTLKRAERGEPARALSTERREGLWCAQTPQMFRFAILQRAFERPEVHTFTDEAQAVEALGFKPRLVRGSLANIKVTYPEDLGLAEAIIAFQNASA